MRLLKLLYTSNDECLLLCLHYLVMYALHSNLKDEKKSFIQDIWVSHTSLLIKFFEKLYVKNQMEKHIQKIKKPLAKWQEAF